MYLKRGRMSLSRQDLRLQSSTAMPARTEAQVCTGEGAGIGALANPGGSESA
jgi:hypothetical protein